MAGCGVVADFAIECACLIGAYAIGEVPAHHAFGAGEVIVALQAEWDGLIAQDADILLGAVGLVGAGQVGHIQARLAVVLVGGAGAEGVAGDAEEILQVQPRQALGAH